MLKVCGKNEILSGGMRGAWQHQREIISPFMYLVDLDCKKLEATYFTRTKKMGQGASCSTLVATLP
jgi:hypothetical protein